MSLAHRDFWPQSVRDKHAPSGVSWEPLATVVARMNDWLAGSGLRALNVETLVFPAARDRAVNPAAGGQVDSWDRDRTWTQVIRVWYETPPPAPAPELPPLPNTPPTLPPPLPPVTDWPGSQ